MNGELLQLAITQKTPDVAILPPTGRITLRNGVTVAFVSGVQSDEKNVNLSLLRAPC